MEIREIQENNKAAIIEGIEANLIELVKQVYRPQYPARHANYEETKELANQMAVHSDGVKPDTILNTRRPNEPEAIKEYRLNVWKPTTKAEFDKLLSSFSKIFDPSLSRIQFPDSLVGIAPGEGLNEYSAKAVPGLGSIPEFFERVVLPCILSDPNAVIAWLPSNSDKFDTEYYKPIPFIFPAENVFLIGPEQYVIEDTATTQLEGGQSGVILHTINKSFWATSYQTSRGLPGNAEFQHVVRALYDFPAPPVTRLKGKVKGKNSPFYYESVINGALPFWDEAVGIASDIQASYVMYVYPERVEYAYPCDQCDKGTALDENGSECACTACEGTGIMNRTGPFGTKVFKPNWNEDGGAQFPGVTYIEKDTKIVELLEARERDQLHRAMSAVGFGVLDKIGASQSGIAKAIDRSEQRATMQRVAGLVFGLIEWSFKQVALWRYSFQFPDRWVDLLPEISEPINFDILTIGEMTDEISRAQQAGVNPQFIQALENDIASKRFGNDHSSTVYLKLLSIFDPFPNVKEDDLFTRFESGVISKRDYVLKSNINKILIELINEDIDFVNLPILKQSEIINKKINVLMDELKKDIPPPSLLE